MPLLRLWKRSTPGEKILIVLTACLVVFGLPSFLALVLSSSSKHPHHQRKSTIATTKSPGKTTTPPEARYLEALTPSSGDTPQAGDTELDGQHYEHSIFYEEVVNPSSSMMCEEEENCRVTVYQLHTGYSRFTARFGILAHGTSAAGQLASGSWSVTVNGKVRSDGNVTANTYPVPLDVHLTNGSEESITLELRATVTEPGIGEANTVVWGDAKVT